jgi:hypothetical protein
MPEKQGMQNPPFGFYHYLVFSLTACEVEIFLNVTVIFEFCRPAIVQDGFAYPALEEICVGKIVI